MTAAPDPREGHNTAKAAELWDAAECCWTGTGCTHDDEAGCADAFWALAKRLKSEAARGHLVTAAPDPRTPHAARGEVACHQFIDTGTCGHSDAPTREGVLTDDEREALCTCGMYQAHTYHCDMTAQEVARIVAAHEAAAWDDCFDDCVEQSIDGMPVNRNPYRGAR